MSEPPASTPPRRTRVHAIDLLRLLASIQMIAGHTIGALLAPEHRVGALFEIWTVARGLTAVAFLFAAGAAFALVAVDAPPERARRRVPRAVGLVVLGYALHLPLGALGGDPELAAAAWRELFAVDVLAAIGVTLLLLELLVRLPHSALSTGVLALALFLVAPEASTLEPQGALMPLTDYLSRRSGSLFPLLPFAGFMLAGAALGRALFDRPRPTLRVATVAAAVLLVGTVAWTTTSPPWGDAYYAWPALSFIRLGAVLALTGALAFATERVIELPRVVTTLAGQSLFLYVAHLLALYVSSVGLARLLGPTLPVAQTAAIAIALIAASALGALLFARLRLRGRRR